MKPPREIFECIRYGMSPTEITEAINMTCLKIIEMDAKPEQKSVFLSLLCVQVGRWTDHKLSNYDTSTWLVCHSELLKELL